MSTLDTAALRDRQGPLKQRYRDDPDAAIVTVRAEGAFERDDEGVVSCTVQGWSGPVRAGLHPSTGGDGEDACSGDMLLEALVACAGVTLRSVATAMGLAVKQARLRATATFDARGTLGVSRDVPVGCRGYRVVAELATDADDAALARLAQLTERYCVVGQSLRDPVSVMVTRTDLVDRP
ncbi:MAG TPA: OsmC family protein [Kineosporiaceae bacterium]